MFTSCLLLAALLTNCADVANCVFARQTGYRFDLTGQVLVIDNHNDPILNVADASGGTRVMGVRHVIRPLPFKSGDTIHVAGIVDIPFDKPMALPCAICRSVRLVEAGTLKPPARVSASDILSGRYDCKLVRVGGRIRRVIRDEIDTTCLYVQFCADDNILYLTTRVQTDTSIESKLRDLIDADVEVVGTCHPSAYMRRRFIGYTIGILSIDAITILKRTPQDPHSVPLLDVNMVADISAFNRLGRRCRPDGPLSLHGGADAALMPDRTAPLSLGPARKCPGGEGFRRSDTQDPHAGGRRIGFLGAVQRATRTARRHNRAMKTILFFHRTCGKICGVTERQKRRWQKKRVHMTAQAAAKTARSGRRSSTSPRS